MKEFRSAACVALASVLSGLVGSAFAGATFTWVGEPMSASGDTISTRGELVYAYNRNSSYTTNDVCGVAFCGIPDETDLRNTSKVPYLTVTPAFEHWDSGFQNEGVSGSYGNLLANGFWGKAEGCTNTIFTLKGLTPGTKYLVQLIIHKHERNIPVSIEDQTIFPYGDPPWKYGGSFLGEFTATAAEEQFTVAYTSQAIINGIQVRNLDRQSPVYIKPEIGIISAEVSGASATISLAGVKVGTDRNGEAANTYALSYSLNGGSPVLVNSVMTDTETSFDIPRLADGSYACEVTMLTDKNEAATNSVRFAINTSMRWKVKPLGETEDAIETKGELVYAYARTDSIVNTVPFEGLGDVNLDKSSMEGYNKAKFYMNRSLYRKDPASTLPDDYVKMQENYWRGSIDGDGLVTMQLKGLKPGKRYLVQIVCSLQEGYASGAQVTTSDGQVAKANGTGWEHGGSLVGIFNAADTTTSFDLTFSRYIVFNAIQVRKLPQAFLIRLR